MEERKKVRRSELVRLKELISSADASQSEQPIDVLLFKLIDDRSVRTVERHETVNMGHQNTAHSYPIWVSELHEFHTSIIDESGRVHHSVAPCGELDEYGKFIKLPHLERIPAYTSAIDAAVSFKASILPSDRPLLIKELQSYGLDPTLWQAKILDGAGATVSSAQMESAASAIVLAVLHDLINNDGASPWIEDLPA
jgi:hypothetical protein